jgi:hypothetical protein
MILYTFLIPKPVWMDRVEENISDIDRQIFRVLLPDRYKDIFRELLKKYKSLNQIMKIEFPDFERQCLQVYRFKGKWTGLGNSQEKVLGYNNP